MSEKNSNTELPLRLETPVVKTLPLILSALEITRRLELETESCFLFERAGQSQSYVFFSPLMTFRIQAGALTVETKEGSQVIAGNPVQELKSILEKCQVSGGVREDVPLFTCGVVGYLGYDCVKYLEKIDLPEVVSGEDEACFVLFRHALVTERKSSVTTLVTQVPQGESREAAAMEQNEIEKQLRVAVHEAVKVGKSSEKLSSSVDHENFAKSVSAIRSHIGKGDIFQCVISKRFTGKSSLSTVKVYERLLNKNPSPYHFHFSGGGQTVVGASPEMLVKVSENKIFTCPIAGTRPRGVDAAEDKRRERQLLTSTKETSEHVMLVDLSRNDIGRVSTPGSVRVTEFMKVQRFSHVMHLVSLVEGDLSPKYSPLDALFACFPAGTLTGAPKIRAMQIISQLETHRRGAYGGAVVLYDFSGELDSCINIRSMVSHGGECYVQAGAGIVFDSRAPREEEEIENKSLATRRAIEETL